ncbi:MAG: hypothetical protein HY565_05190 [Candidatus Kerfeldbacteria bacterium]|nr:hypothetical protein [Candidatus Kerfeldbacteria bacterium]
MSEPTAKRERRPAHIPPTWRTRQQAQADLALRSPTALTKLLEQLRPEAEDFQIHGKAGYLSPQLIERMRLELSVVEDIRDLPGYMSGTAVQEVIGCSFAKFSRLVLENPPSVQNREVIRARNNNSEVNPVYSPQYIDSLRRLYEPPAPRRMGQGSSGTPSDTERTSYALAGKILERIDTAPKPNLIDPTAPERAELLAQVAMAITELDQIPHQNRDQMFQQLLSQLYSASEYLQGTQPMPQGVERLLAKARHYLHQDED